MKRGISLLLAIIMIASSVPATVIAGEGEGTPNTPVEVYYDFAVRNAHAANLTLGDYSVENSDNQTYMEGLFDSGDVKWMYEGKFVGNTRADNSGEDAADFNKNMYTTTGIQVNKAAGYNWWYAIRLKSPGTGTFDVTVNTHTVPSNNQQKHSVWTEAYMFDAAGVDAGTTTIAESLVAANRLSSDFQPTTEMPDASLGKYAFTEGKEYILVLRQTKSTYDGANIDSLRTANLYIEGITAKGQVAVSNQQVKYDFALPTLFPSAINTSGATNIETQKTAIETLYNNEEIDWAYVGYKPATEKADGTGNTLDRKYNKFESNAVYPNGSGIYFKTNYGYNWWYAVKLRAPGTGTYTITANSAIIPEGTSGNAGIWLEAYMLNASVIANAADDAAVRTAIDGALASATRLQDYKPTKTALDVNLGEFTFDANTEYILVLRQNVTTYNAAKTALGNNNFSVHLHMAGLTMDVKVQSPEESTTATETTTETTTSTTPTTPDVSGEPAAGYDMNLLGYYTELTADVEEAANQTYLDALYEAGKISWKYEAKQNGRKNTDGTGEEVNTFTKHSFVKGSGLQVNASYGFNWWYAIRVKAPGSGTYDLSIQTNTAPAGDVQKHSMWTETYFFDAENLTGGVTVNDMLVDSNKIKNFAPTSENPDAFLGNVATEAGKEYIIVLRMTLGTYQAANADGLRTSNLYFKNISFVEADPPAVPKAEYNFDFLTIYGDAFSTDAFAVKDQQAKIREYFNAGHSKWAFEGFQNGRYSPDGTGDEVDTLTKHAFIKGSGLQANCTHGYNWWYAIRVKAPGTGTYDVDINTFYGYAGEVAKHSIWTETYFFDAAKLTGKKTVNDMLVEGNKIKMFAPTVEDPDAYVGNVEMKAGKEYIIVLRMTRDTLFAAKETGLHTSNLYLKGITFTEAEPPAIPKAEYSFDYLTIYGDTFSTDAFAVTNQKTKIRDYFKAGHSKWAFEGYQNGREKTDGTGKKVNTFTNHSFQKGKGLQAYATYGFNWWYAIRVKAPGTGTYDVTLNTFLGNLNGVDKHSMWTETYFFDAAKLTGKKTVNDMLVEGNKIKRFAPTVENPDAYVGNVSMKAGKEYIIVLRMTLDTYNAANEDGQRSSNLYLKGITFKKAAPPVPESTGYDFDLLANYPDDFKGGEESVTEQKKKINQFYKNGYIDWAYNGFGLVNKDSTGEMYQNALEKGSGLKAYTLGYDWYYAIRFRSPGKGAHKVVLDSFLVEGLDKATNKTVKKHSIWTEAYIMEASLLDNGKTTVADFALKKNLLGTFNPTVKNPDVELGYYTFEKDTEYILILRQTKKTYEASKETGRNTANLYLEGLKFTYTKNPPKKVVDTSKVIYDFDLGDPKNGIYAKSPTLNEKMSDISRLYDLEELNWELAEAVGSDAWKFSGNGVTMYALPDDYIAFRIKSPGKGLYTLSLNHAVGGRGGTGAVYVIPADSEDVIFATDNHNRVGKLSFANEDGNVTPQDGSTSVIGTWEFGSAKEYIVVIEAYEKSPYTNECYMYVSQLICEKGDKTAGVVKEKKAHSVVVDPGPVKVTEGTPYQAAGEVAGRDWFYLPLEGKKMAIYDIDGMEFVRHVDTPFTTCRGIAVDDDGIVWMVGDNPYIFRYDPVLDVGESVYYYKGKTDPNSKDTVYGASVGFDCEIGDDGCLYFGVFQGGNVAKYEMATGKFTNLGSTSTYDAQGYACAVVYNDGYVYSCINGDNNADGVRTYELVKMDAVTGKLVKKLDITPHVSQKEVMMRNMSICGGVLFIGGEQNEVKKALAVDAETLEIVDLGIQGFINYGTTPEIDGKVYFLAAGLGICEFDGATRTAKRIEAFKDANAAFRLGEDAFVTIEANDLFPGTSVLTWKGSIESPVIYNFETNRSTAIADLIQDQYGSAQTIRAITRGPEDTNWIFMGAFNTNNCSVFDTVEGKIVHTYEAQSAQTDAMFVYEGKLYAGNYNAGVLTQIHLEDERRNVSLISLKSQYEQSRIHNIYADDGMVFCGSIPDMYGYGGCFVMIDLETLEQTVERNIVKDQSIVATTYKDGIAYIGSCITGGTGSQTRTDTSAKIVIYDTAAKKKLLEIDPHDYISGLPKQITGIGSLFKDSTGKIWGLIGGTLVSMSYNKTTGKFSMKEELALDKEWGSGWLPPAFIEYNGYLYTNFGNKEGVQKVNMKNPSQHERIPITPTNDFAIGNDGNMYYAANTATLYMYPLNVQSSDWAAAGKVDAMFAKLGKITLDSEEAIKAARAAYEALSWTQKGLVQDLDILVAAEIDLLECKIDSIGEVTLDDKALIEEIAATYAKLNAKNRSYVKNYYNVFIPAKEALQKLIDAQEAARVQAMIDTIPGMGEITLDKEAAIREIEAAYKALSKEQRALVDAKYLLDALETIAKLRAERIQRFIDLLAGLGEITLEDEPAITEAREIFDWMTMLERESIDFSGLVAAEKALQTLQKAAAAEVDALIMAIGNRVTHGSGEAIEAARAAYEALTPGSKQYVKLLAVLEQAEALYAQLGLHPAIYISIAVVVVAAAAFLLWKKGILKFKKKAVPAKEEEKTKEEA